MQIIEFCGLPGCGKTTLCEMLIKQKIDYFKVFCRKDLFNCNKVLLILKLLLFLFCPKHKLFNKNLLSLARQFFFLTNIRHIANLMIIFIRLHQLSKTSEDNIVFILEEGFVQHLTSLAYDKPMKSDTNLKDLILLLQSSFDIVIINCNLDIVTAGQRIGKRNKGRRDRYLLDDAMLYSKLNVKQSNIDTVLEHFCCQRIDINMNQSPTEAFNDMQREMNISL